MKEKILPILLTLLIVPLAQAQVISLGVSPSVVKIDFYKYNSYTIKFSFFNNGGEVDANYTLELPKELNINCNWCNGFIVPKGTNLNNPIKKELTIPKSPNGTYYIYLYGKPVNYNESSGGLKIRHGIAIRLEISSPIATNTTTTTIQNQAISSSGSISTSFNTTNKTSTTSNTITTINLTTTTTQSNIQSDINVVENKSSQVSPTGAFVLNINPQIIIIAVIIIALILAYKFNLFAKIEEAIMFGR
jgi:hypothetical protein